MGMGNSCAQDCCGAEEKFERNEAPSHQDCVVLYSQRTSKPGSAPQELPRLGLTGQRADTPPAKEEQPRSSQLFGSVKAPHDAKDATPVEKTSAPFMEIGFEANGQVRSAKVYHRPLGAEFSRQAPEVAI